MTLLSPLMVGKPLRTLQVRHKINPTMYLYMEEGGNLLVHPSLVGQSLKEKAEPVYNECAKATAEGVWVDYVWKEKQKHTYANL